MNASTASAPPHRHGLARYWPSLAAVAAVGVVAAFGGLPTTVTAVTVAVCALVYLVWSQINHQDRSRQLLGMAVFTGVAVVALAVEPRFGDWVVAAGLLAHAGWDVYHHRRRRTVPLWYSQLCAVVDLGLATLIVTMELL